MKKLLLIILALSSLLMSCIDEPKLDPAPNSPYAITAEGKLAVKDIVLKPFNGQERPLNASGEIIIVTKEYGDDAPSALLGRFGAQNNTIKVDISQSISKINPTRTIKDLVDASLEGCQFSNPNVKIKELYVSVAENGNFVGELQLNNLKLSNYIADIFYSAEDVTVTGYAETKGLVFKVNMNVRKGFNTLIKSTEPDDESIYLLTANNIPSTDMHWTVSIDPE